MLRQSEEMGTSLGETLTVFSDDMRSKRMLRAEEKAMALPAKLMIPLILFIFPCLMGVLILPADVSWGEGGVPAALPTLALPPVADEGVVQAIAQAIQSGQKTALLLGARALREPGLMAASRIASSSSRVSYA